MSQDDRYTDAEVCEGEHLLARVLADLAKRGETATASPPVSHPLSYMRGNNLQALIVQHRGRGWVADVLFRDVPPHCPETIGTAEAAPFRTRRSATRAGKEMVRQILRTPVPAELVAWMIAGRPDCGPPMLIGDQVIFFDYRA
ncbi:MAG: hypothetical protein JG765_2666 [Cereibacter sp.]|jgi:hypothetical protein|nr:hypothetical protein [Cereibacter sp.]